MAGWRLIDARPFKLLTLQRLPGHPIHHWLRVKCGKTTRYKNSPLAHRLHVLLNQLALAVYVPVTKPICVRNLVHKHV